MLHFIHVVTLDLALCMSISISIYIYTSSLILQLQPIVKVEFSAKKTLRLTATPPPAVAESPAATAAKVSAVEAPSPSNDEETKAMVAVVPTDKRKLAIQKALAKKMALKLQKKKKTCCVCKRDEQDGGRVANSGCSKCEREVCEVGKGICSRLVAGKVECIKCTKDPPICLVCSRATVQELCCFCREPICLQCGSEVEIGTKVYLCCPQCAEKEGTGVNEDDEAAKAAEEEERLALLQDDKDQEEADAERVYKTRRVNSKEEAKPSSKAKAKLLKDLKDSAAAVNFKSRQ